jgi:hypothetical protein
VSGYDLLNNRQPKSDPVRLGGHEWQKNIDAFGEAYAGVADLQIAEQARKSFNNDKR